MLIGWPLLLMFNFINEFIAQIAENLLLQYELHNNNNNHYRHQMFLTDITMSGATLNANKRQNSSFDLLSDLILNQTHRDFEIIYEQNGFEVQFNIQSKSRQIKSTASITKQILERLKDNEFQFKVAIMLKQIKLNTGTILCIQKSNVPFLELHSSGRHDEMRLYYLTRNHNDKPEVFPYHLADNQWHQIHLIFYNFHGAFQEFGIHIDKNDFFTTCDHLDDFNVKQQTLSNYVVQLTKRLADTEKQLMRYQQAECKDACYFNGTRRLSQEVWKHNCHTCVCNGGEVQCKKMACDKNVCKNPVYSVNSCCPICLDPCKFQTEIIEHGELFEFNKCTICQCNNGKISNCNKTSQKTISTTSTTSTLTLTLTLNSKCPPINCPEENNVIMDENCCQICPKHDYCLKFAPSFCDEFASCYNLNDSFECECNRGYFGNGTTCEDIDECLQTQNMFGHNCNLSRSQCVNTIGSYYCECKVGFENVDNLTCADVNECLTRGHKCDANARCSNFDGGYRCECNENYVGNGFYCEESCNATCLNGGICTRSNECLCRKGFWGTQCENDLDECALNLHHCDTSSDCVNMPGWYYCKCKTGYKATFENNSISLQVHCEDINECDLMIHTCGSDSQCVNTLGHFTCTCRNCTKINCVYQGDIIEDGAIVQWPNINSKMIELITTLTSSTCKQCQCHHGVITCDNYLCNCNGVMLHSTVRKLCCPQCNQKNHTCYHNSIRYDHGQKWLSNCETCQCRFGHVDCQRMECPPVHCTTPIFQIGDCCPRCDHDFCFSRNRKCAFAAKFYDSGTELIESNLISSQANYWYLSKTFPFLILYVKFEMTR